MANSISSPTNKQPYYALISYHPYFSNLSVHDIIDLASLAIEFHFAANQVMVYKGDAVERIYLVIKGSIEVATTLKNKDQLLPLTILSECDLIGLNQTDFFHKEELHANTLTTLTDVLVIGWPQAVFF